MDTAERDALHRVREGEWAHCRANAHYFIETYCHIEDKDAAEIIQPFRLWPMQREALSEILSNRLTIILKARQLGITWLALSAALHELLFCEGHTCIALSRTEEEAKAEAQAVLDRLNGGEDFDTVMNEKSEDSGLAGNPDGYIFTEGDMMPAFYEAAKALGEGETSGLVQTDYGYHIIKRIPVDYDGELENYRSAIVMGMGKNIDELLNQWVSEADVQTTDEYDKVTYQTVYDYAPIKKPVEQTGAEDAPAETPAEGDAAAAE